MKSRLRRPVGALMTVLLVGLWAVTLRPQAIGGPALFVIVRGDSMLPTYANGDLLLVEKATAYGAGEPVAYRVPAGEIGAGHLVVHRIVAGDATNGFVVQGDNNPAPDPWAPRTGDIAGRVHLAVPGVGLVIGFLVRPVNAASLAAAVVVAWLAVPIVSVRRRPESPAGRT